MSQEEIPELHRVPGEWRCLRCERRVSTAPAQVERPPCPAGCPKLCVAVTWQRWCGEREAELARVSGVLAAEAGRAEAALAAVGRQGRRTAALLTALALAAGTVLGWVLHGIGG